MAEEPIRIVIIDEVAPVVHVAERRAPSLGAKVQRAGHNVAAGAQTAWERVPQEEIGAAAQAGVRVSRRGASSSLRLLSRLLERIADRLRP